ncbi:ATP-binding protein [Actinoplanes utahensis]|uniref:ATP-binding protein n=1 Tax=Actinoplanes utahensis TaxID=1869 RepID=UPI00068E3D82|nr:helix-turn-helix domain-containing protein [Actinoplanes utahensis]GIF32435.1 hypothetical protein Aut01nite_54210 [Actinoplanes utahensis]
MFGEVVRAHRHRLGLSQEDLAHRSGISVRGIRKIEAQLVGAPRPVTVRLLADAFGMSGAGRDEFCQLALVARPDRAARAGTPAGRELSGARAAPAGAPDVRELLGRDTEMSALLDRADAARDGGFHLVWVDGEAGAGKSALARALAGRLRERGWRAATGHSPEVTGVPSAWAWTDVVRALAAGGPAGAPPVDGAAPAPFRTAQAVVACLREHAGPLLVVLDDVHRAGEETLQILRYAATELADRPVLVVATFRPTEVGPALSATRAALTGPRSSRLSLAGLGETGVAGLLHAHLGAVVAPDLVRLITGRTGGNPLFVGETARLIADQGAGAAADLVPAGVDDVLRRRLERLPPSALATLRTAAVFGIEAEAGMVLAAGGAGAAATLDGLEAAVGAGLLTEPSPGMVRFPHVLIRDIVYRDLTWPRRAALHAEALRLLSRARPGETVALAHHALASAGPDTARSAAVRGAEAGRAALASCSYTEAITLLSTSVAVLDAPPGLPRTAGSVPRRAGDDALYLDLLCMLVSAQGHAGDVRGARQSRERAVRTARRLGGLPDLARAYCAYDAPTLWTNRLYQEPDHQLIAGLEATLSRTPAGEAARRCRLLATLALETEATDAPRTDRASGEAVEIAAVLDDPELLCRALNARYRYVATLGPDRWGELDDIGKRQLDVATANELTAYRAQAHHILCMAQLARNNLDEARRHLDRAAGHATIGQLPLALGIIAMFRGLRELIAGRFGAAEQAYAPVIAQLKHVGSPNIDEVDLLIRFCIEHARGGPGSRKRMTVLADLAGPIHQRYGDAVAEPYVRLLIAAGRRAQARAAWRPQVPLARDHYWFRWMALRAENAVALGDRETAAACYRALLPWSGHLPGLLHAHITLGPVDHTLGDLARALGRPGDAAGHYADAAGIAQRIGAEHWAARARAALGDTGPP